MTTGRPQGSLIIEAALCLGFIAIPLLCFGLEIYRAASYRALFHAMSFHYVRLVALGVSPARAEQRVRARWKAAFPHKANFELSPAAAGLIGRVYYRYPSFLPYVQSRFQVTSACPFYFSR